MDEPISARYEWNADAYVDALMAHQRQLRTSLDRVILRVILLIFLLIFSVMTTVVLRAPGQILVRGTFLAGMTVVLGLLLGIYYLTFWSSLPRRRIAQKAFKHVSTGSVFVEWSFSEDQVSNQTRLTSSTFLWPFFIKFVEAKKGFMLYQNETMFQWIPAHGFSSESELKRFAELARSRVANHVLLGESQFPTKPDSVGLDEF